jgi:transcriptional regulator with XRE-family HTH domain
MNDIKTTVAGNIAALRKAKGLTQLDLAERLSYSDKAVSKWERGESLPDVATLVELADLFEVPLDALVRSSDAASQAVLTPSPLSAARKRNRIVISSLGVLLVWFFAVLAFVILSALTALRGEWIVFVGAVPVSMVVLLVFNSIWFNKRRNYLIITVLMWSLLTTVHLLLLLLGYHAWQLYLIGIPAQVIIILWSSFRFGSRI